MTSLEKSKTEHVCNTTNKNWKYCIENKLPLIALPEGTCIWCGDDLK